LPQVLAPIAGPLGLRRENQNSAAPVVAKASGSRLKKVSLGVPNSSLMPATTTSSSSSGFSGQNASLSVKPTLKKAMKAKKELASSVATKAKRKKRKKSVAVKK